MYTDTQILIAQILTKSLSGLSLLFLLSLIYIIYKMSDKITIVSEVIIVLFSVDSIYCVAVLLPTGVNSDNSILCYFQACLIMGSTIFIIIWIACIGFTLWKSFTMNSSLFDEKVKLYRLVYYAIALFATIISLIL